jgi:O-antigen/teichoic acid export membrane protein
MRIATQRLTAQAAIIGIGRLLNMLAAAGTLVVLARVLPDRESYGAICQLIILYMLLSQIFAVGLPQSTYYFLPRYEGGERRGFLTQTVVLLSLSGLLLAAGLFTGAEAIGRILNSPQLPELLRVFAIYPIFMLPTLAVEGTLLHAQRPAATVLFNLAVRIGMFAGLVVPALLQMSLVQMITVWVAVAGVMWLAALGLLFSTVAGQPLIWRRSMLREEGAFSAPLALSALIAVTGTYLDRILVSNQFGPAAFGTYTNATVEVPTVTMVTNATAVVLMAEFSRRTSAGEHKAVMPIWHRAMTKSAVLTFASLGFLAFWGHETMRLLFTSRYAESGTIFSIYVWVIPVLILTGQSLFISLGATRPLITLSLVGIVIEIACLVGFGKLLGLAGMALGVVVARYLNAAVGMHWYAHKLTDIGWRALLPWGNLGLALLVAVAAGAVSRTLYVLPIAWPPVVLFACGLLLFLAAYFVGLRLTRLSRHVRPGDFLRLQREPVQEVTA